MEIKDRTRTQKDCTPSEVLEICKKIFKILATRLWRCTREGDAKKINALFFKEPSKMSSHIAPTAEIERYKNIKGRKNRAGSTTAKINYHRSSIEQSVKNTES